jgi:hypothetical protein
MYRRALRALTLLCLWVVAAFVVVWGVVSLVAGGDGQPGSHTSTNSSLPTALVTPNSALGSGTPPSVRWDIPAGSVPQGEDDKLREAVAAASSGPTQTTISAAVIQNGWGVLYGERQPADPVVDRPPAEAIFLANKVPAGWTITKPGDAAFCQVLKDVPESVLDQTSKLFFTNCFSNP